MTEPTATEIADLTAWLRRLVEAGRDVDPDEINAYLDAKRELLARIEANR